MSPILPVTSDSGDPTDDLDNESGKAVDNRTGSVMMGRTGFADLQICELYGNE